MPLLPTHPELGRGSGATGSGVRLCHCWLQTCCLRPCGSRAPKLEDGFVGSRRTASSQVGSQPETWLCRYRGVCVVAAEARVRHATWSAHTSRGCQSEHLRLPPLLSCCRHHYPWLTGCSWEVLLALGYSLQKISSVYNMKRERRIRISNIGIFKHASNS